MGCIQLCWLDMQKINFYWSAVCGSSGGLHSECGLCKCLQLRWVWAGKSVCQFSVIDRDRIWCRHDSEGLSFIESTPEKWPHALQHWNSLSTLFLVRFPATPLGSKLFLQIQWIAVAGFDVHHTHRVEELWSLVEECEYLDQISNGMFALCLWQGQKWERRNTR